MFVCFREGRSNAHIKGDYQRIGDVMLKNFQGLKVRQHFFIKLLHICNYSNKFLLIYVFDIQILSIAPDSKPAQAI